MLKCMHQLKMMSTDEVSSPNFSERNSGYYERNSRLVADNDSYIRRTNNNNNSIRNGPFLTTSVLSERSSNNNTHQQNNRVPSSSASWYDTVTTSTNGPGGSGNVVASAAGGYHQHYYTTAAATHTSTALISSSPPASSILTTTPSTTTVTALGLALYQRGSSHDSSLLNKRSKLNKLLKTSSERAQSIGAESPTSLATSTTTTATTTSSTSASYINSSCSTINSSSNNNLSSSSNLTKTAINNSGGTGNSNLNAMTSASTLAISNCSSSHHHMYVETSANTNAYSSSTSTNTTSAIANSTTSHNATRTTPHHGRSTTSSSRSHSRSPSSYSSSHSSSSSSHASSRSHASSPILGSDLAVTSSSRSGAGTRSHMLQSVIATPTQGSLSHNTTGGGGGGCSSSSSSSSSGSCTATTPVVHSEDNRPLAIRVRNLPARSSDTSLKDGLFHEYKKHGKVTWVKVVGQNSERYALVCFKKPDDVEKALEVSHDKLFFGCKIEVEPYQGYDVEDNEFRPYEAELDEYHPKSTRTLFIGNLEKDITASELRSHFECFGEIIEIDIKKQGMNAYAFCQYSDIVSVVKAMRKMDGEHLGSNRIKLGFGKSMPTNCVWIDGIGDKISESHLQSQFSRYGAVTKVIVDRARQLALVLYEQIQYAQTAVKEMRGTTLRGRRLQVDFASRECQDAFYEKLEKQNSAGRFNRYDSQSRSRASSFSRHQSNDGCSPSNTPGSSSGSSVTGIVPPILSSAIVAGSTAAATSTLVSGQTITCGAASSTPSRTRGPRSHTIDFDYADIRKFRAYDEYSQGSTASHDEDASGGTPLTPLHNAFSSNIASSGLRSDSPLLSRLGPVVGSASICSGGDTLEAGGASRRRCDKSPVKQKGDIRFLQKERFHLLEQLEECPSSGDENVASPRKRLRLDHHHHSSSLSSGLLHTSQDANLNCDEILHDSPLHRKADSRRLSDFGKHQHQPAQTLSSQSQHYHQQSQQQQNLSRRPSNDLTATLADHNSVRHNSTSSSSSEHYAHLHHQLHGSGTSTTNTVPCKRRRVVGGAGGSSNNCNVTTSMGATGLDEFQQHTSRGRGHSLHSQHSHEASCGDESADGSRPGTPLCDERPEVLPTEPRRVPRDRPHEPMVLPLPKFGIQFFQQFRNSVGAGGAASNAYHHHHSMSSTCLAYGSSGHSHTTTGFGLPNSHANSGTSGCSNHSSLSHNLTTSLSTTTIAAASGQQSTTHLPSPSSTRYSHWRPTQQHHHHHQQQHHHHGQQQFAATATATTLSPMRSRSLSSNSSDSEAQAHTGGSPSLEERIRTLDEMYERWSGGGGGVGGGSTINSNVAKRGLDFISHNSGSSWQSREHSSSSMHSAPGTGSSPTTATIATTATRHKFLDLDVNEMQPSEIVKSVLAKKSIFDDDLQRLKKNHQWFEPTSNDTSSSNLSCSIGLPNLSAATKLPIVGGLASVNANRTTAAAAVGSLLQRLSSLSPMNSPQASMSPYNSPSPSPSVGVSFANNNNTTISKPATVVASITTAVVQSAATALTTGNTATKGLQYPFPTHPPLPNTAAPAPVAQPPPPAELTKPTIEVIAEQLTEAQSINKPKPNIIIKSHSVPAESSQSLLANTTEKSLTNSTTITTTTAANVADAVRVLTKSNSVPGSTNVGTVKTKSSPDSAIASGSSSLTTLSSCSSSSASNSSDNNNKTESENTINLKSTAIGGGGGGGGGVVTPPNTVKKHEKSHHKHEKKSKLEQRRKKSLTTTPRIEEEGASSESDGVEKELEKEKSQIPATTQQATKDKDQKERQEREKRERERELKKQQQHEKEAQERQEREEREERHEAQARADLEKSEREARERQQAQEERERKEREENERKLQAQREREREHKLVQQRRQKEEAAERQKATTTECQQHLVEQTTTTTSTTENPLANKSENTTTTTNTTTTKHHQSSSGHKTTRSSPTRHAKRRLSSQDGGNNGVNAATNVEAATHGSHVDEQAKRPRTDNQQHHQQQPQQHQAHTKETKKHHHHHHHKHHKSEHVIANSANEEPEKSFKNKEHTNSKNKTTKHNKSSNDLDLVSTPFKSKVNLNENITSDQEQTVIVNKPNSTDDDEHEILISATPKTTPIQGQGHGHSHKQREQQHSSTSCSSKHKSKREHRDKKRHSLTDSMNTMTDEEIVVGGGASAVTNRVVNTTTASDTMAAINTTPTTTTVRDLKLKNYEQQAERKFSRGCSDDGVLMPHTPTSRTKLIPTTTTPTTTTTRKLIMSSADSDDSEDTAAAKKRSIFEVPDPEGPYISMYDKVKARSCKNMQKQAEEKKIRAKFSQLKKSRANKREGNNNKKRSASYDGDSDSEFDAEQQVQQQHNNKSRSNHHGHHHHHGGLSSSTEGGEALDEDNDDDDEHEHLHDNDVVDDDDDDVSSILRRRSSQAAIKQRAVTNIADEVAARRMRMQQNLLRLCDNDDSSEDDELSGNVTNKRSNLLSNKRNSHAHAQRRIASDSESQSQPAAVINTCNSSDTVVVVKVKQETQHNNSKEIITPTNNLLDLKIQIKQEEESFAENISITDDLILKCKQQQRSSSISSLDDEQKFANIKCEPTTDDEIKKVCSKTIKAEESPVDYNNKLHTLEQNLKEFSTADVTRKKHKKSKKRQKNANLCSSIDAANAASIQEFIAAETKTSKELLSNVAVVVDNDDSKKQHTTLTTTPPPVVYDVFDELKRGECIVKLELANTPTTCMDDDTLKDQLNLTDSEKKRHKERKDKKREKLRSSVDNEVITTTNDSSFDTDKLSKEERRHRLKKAAKKSKSLAALRRGDCTTAITTTTITTATTTTAIQHSASLSIPTTKESNEDKLEDIFGPISDDEVATQFSDSECKLNTHKISLPANNIIPPTSTNAASPYKQAPLTPKSQTIVENEENILKVGIIGGNGAAALPPELVVIGNATQQHNERERLLRKEKREKKRREREKSREQQQKQQQQQSVLTDDDENSVDLAEAGRALEAQLMEEFDNKIIEEDATPSTATTYRSDMTDVFRFSDGDENSIELVPDHPPLLPAAAMKQKEKKKKKKRSKEEKHHHHHQHQRRESSSSTSNTSTTHNLPPTVTTTQCTSTMSPPMTTTPSAAISSKLTIDIPAATKLHTQKALLETADKEQPMSCCKPSPSLPCLIDDEDIMLNNAKISTPTAAASQQKSSNERLSLSPIREKKMISPIPKTPTTTTTAHEHILALNTTTPTTPVSHAGTSKIFVTPTTPTTIQETKIETIVNSTTPTTSSSISSIADACQKKKSEKFITAFDDELADKISESAVKSITDEFNTSLDDTIVAETKIAIESPSTVCTNNKKQQLEKHEDTTTTTKSRVQISQEETESAVSALLGESFGNSTGSGDFVDAYNDVTCMDDLSASGNAAVVDEEAAIAARALESSLKEQETISSSSINEADDDDRNEVSMAVQSLSTVVDIPDIKPPDTPQSERGLQIDTDTEDTNADEADSSGNSLKIDEKIFTTSSPNEKVENQLKSNITPLATVITKVTLPIAKVVDVKTTQPPQSPQPPPAPPALPASPINKAKEVQASSTPIALKATLPSMISLDEPTAITPTTASISTTSASTTTVVAHATTSSETVTSVAPKVLFSTKLTTSNSLSTEPVAQIMQPPTISIPDVTTTTAQFTAPPQMVASTLLATEQSVNLSPRLHGALPSLNATVTANSQHIVQLRANSAQIPTTIQLSPVGMVAQSAEQQQQQLPSPKAITQAQTQQNQQQQQQEPASSTINASLKPNMQSTAVQLGGSPTITPPNSSSNSKLQQNTQKSATSIEPTTLIPKPQINSPTNISVPVTLSTRVPAHSPLSKSVIEHCATMAQSQTQQPATHGPPLPLTIQKMSPVTTHATIISKVVNVQPQQATQQQLSSPTRLMHTATVQQQQQQPIVGGHIAPIASMSKAITNPYLVQQHQQQQQQESHLAQISNQTRQTTNQQKIQPTKLQQQQQQPNAVFYRQQQQQTLPQKTTTTTTTTLGQQSHTITTQSIIVQQQIVGRSPYAQQQQQQQQHQQQHLQTSLSIPITTTTTTSSISGNNSNYMPQKQINPSIIIEPLNGSPKNKPTKEVNIEKPNTTPTTKPSIESLDTNSSASPLPKPVENVSVIRTSPAPNICRPINVEVNKPTTTTITKEDLIVDSNIKNNNSELNWSKDAAATAALGTVIKKIEQTEETKKLTTTSPTNVAAAAAASMPNIAGDDLQSNKTKDEAYKRKEQLEKSIASMSSTDHDTEDETESRQQTQLFDAIKIENVAGGNLGISTAKTPRGGAAAAKRGRQARGGKKQAAITTTPTMPQVETEQLGIQTRLRKPLIVTTPTRGRKGRPPRNTLLTQRALEQQLQQQESSQQQLNVNQMTKVASTAAPTTTTTTTTAEKKSRHQTTVAADKSSDQDVYEFHDDIAEEPTTTTKAASNDNEDIRPRLILTIKSPGQATPSVKACEKPPSDPLAITTTTTTIQQPPSLENTKQMIEVTQSLDEQQAVQNAINTRKSRRLQEKDRSTIDDVIEDVVRNTQTPPPPPPPSSVVSALPPLPKGAQTPPRRSGRNVAATNNPKKNETTLLATTTPTTPNAIGRPRRSKDRKISAESPNNNESLNISEQQHITKQQEQLSSSSSSIQKASEQATKLQKTNEISTQQQQLTHSATVAAQMQQISTQQHHHHPQHPKKKAIAAAEIESYAAAAANSSTANQSAISALPSSHGGMPMLHTAAPATQKITGGTADVLNKSLIDPITGAISAAMQHGKEGSLPLGTGTAAVKKPLQQQQRLLADNNNQLQTQDLPLQNAATSSPTTTTATPITHKMQLTGNLHTQQLTTPPPPPPCSIATPITALTKPLQAEQAASATTLTVPASLANKPVSVVVKTTQPAPPVVIQQQIVQPTSTTQQATILQSTTTLSSPTNKQPILMQQSPLMMHAQHINVRPPTLKAHVLNSQKQINSQQQTTLTPITTTISSQIHHQHHHQQQQHHQQQTPTQQSTLVINSGGNMMQTGNASSIPTTPLSAAAGAGAAGNHHVIQSNIISRHNLQLPPTTQAATTVLQQQHQQLLVNIPPAHSPHNVGVVSTSQAILNSPRLQNQPTLVIKQGGQITPVTPTPAGSQVLHVVSSKAPPPPTPQQQQSIYQQHPQAPQHSYIPTPTATSSNIKQQITVVPLEQVHQQQQQKQQQQQQHGKQHSHVTLQQKQIQPPSLPTMGVSIIAHQQQPPQQQQPPKQQQQQPQQQTMVLPPGMPLPMPPHPSLILQSKSMHLHAQQQLTPSPPANSLSKQNPSVHNLQTQSAAPIISSSPPAAIKAQQTQASILAGTPTNLRAAIPSISPQGQARVTPLLLPTGMPVGSFEPNMHDIGKYGGTPNSARGTQSPPPAHQQLASPITPNESFTSGPLRGVPSRENFMIYQQLLRPQETLNATLRCPPADYDDKILGSSPPLELRRPGSVPRTVPHSLQSPQDRTSDSPQAAQIYVHNTRIPPPPHPHYSTEVGTSRGFYDAAGRPIAIEPPPAHRSAAGNSPFMSTPPVHPPPPPSTPTAITASHTHSNNLIEREQLIQREQQERLKMATGVVTHENLPAGVNANATVATSSTRNLQAATPPQANQVVPPPLQPSTDSLLTLLQRYPVMWQGLLALKTDQAAVQMHFVFGNPHVARASLPCNSDGSTPPLRIAQRMRLEQTQLEGVAKKMQYENEHCMLLALPCGRDHADVLQHSRNLQTGFITYLQQKMAAGIVNIPVPGSEQAAYVVHIFPSCDFANENLERAAPDLKNRVAEIAHLLIVIATV